MFLLNDYFVFDQRPSLRGFGAEFLPAGGPISSGRHIGNLGFVDNRIIFSASLTKIMIALLQEEMPANSVSAWDRPNRHLLAGDPH
jgi:hypothetical protein